MVCVKTALEPSLRTWTSMSNVANTHHLLTNAEEMQHLVKELFSYLDYTETTDSGRVWHPVQISCARALMCEPLGECLSKLKRLL